MNYKAVEAKGSELATSIYENKMSKLRVQPVADHEVFNSFQITFVTYNIYF